MSSSGFWRLTDQGPVGDQGPQGAPGLIPGPRGPQGPPGEVPGLVYLPRDNSYILKTQGSIAAKQLCIDSKCISEKQFRDLIMKSQNHPDSIKNKLPKVVGSKKSISTYTTDTEGHLLSGGGVQTSGGVVLEVEGKVLVAGTEDLASVPDESGRRWLAPSIFGKIVGMNEFKGGAGSFKFRKELEKSKEQLELGVLQYGIDIRDPEEEIDE